MAVHGDKRDKRVSPGDGQGGASVRTQKGNGGAQVSRRALGSLCPRGGPAWGLSPASLAHSFIQQTTLKHSARAPMGNKSARLHTWGGAPPFSRSGRQCTHTRAHTCAHTHACTHVRAHVCAHTNGHARAHTHTHVRMHTRAHTHAHARTSTHTRTHMHERTHTHKHTRARAHTHTHTHT